MINKIRILFTMIQMIITVSTVIILMFLFRNKTHAIRKKWAAMQMKLLGVTLEVEGEQDKNAQMLIMNHQSVLDIIVHEHLHDTDIAWVAKKEIGDIPWFGNILNLPNMIQVQRESKSSLIKLLKDAKNRLSHNRPLAIFPEGTRTDGTKLRKFKSGAKIIADKFELNVQPIIIIGTRKILDSQNLSQQSGTVKVIYLPTVKAEKTSDWFKTTEQKMAHVLEENLNDI